MSKVLVLSAGVVLLALPVPALAQSAGSAGAGQFQAGYGGARYTTARPQTGSTRDANGNRLIVDGLIQSGASSYSNANSGVASSYSGVGSNSGFNGVAGSTAIGNNLNVVVQGNWNTVIVNSTQTNTGNVSAGTQIGAPNPND